MTILNPSTLETIAFRTSGWDAVHNTNITKVNDYLGKMMTATDGEVTVESEYSDTTPVFHVKNSTGTKLFEVLANGTVFPSGGAADVIHGANQADVTYTDIADINYKLFVEYNPILELTGSVSLDLSGVISKLTVKGDASEYAGVTYLHDVPSDEGTITLSSSISDITVAGSVSNPDFSGRTGNCYVVGGVTTAFGTDNHGATRKLTTASPQELEISTISTNTITFTSAAPTVNVVGSSLTFIPTVEVTSVVTVASNQDIIFEGISFTNTVNVYGKATFNNCLFYNNSTPLVVDGGEVHFTSTTIAKTEYGLAIKNGGKGYGSISIIYGTGTWSTNVDMPGVWLTNGSYANMQGSRISFQHYGILIEDGSVGDFSNVYWIHTFHDSTLCRYGASLMCNSTYSNTTWGTAYYSDSMAYQSLVTRTGSNTKSGGTNTYINRLS